MLQKGLAFCMTAMIECVNLLKSSEFNSLEFNMFLMY